MKPISRTPVERNQQNAPVEGVDQPQNAGSVEQSHTDLSEKVQSGKRHLPKAKESRSFFSFVPRLVGRTGIGIAVAGAILGTCLGTPEGRTPQNSVPLDSVRIEAPVGDHVLRGTRALDGVIQLIAPDGIDRRQALDAVGHISFSVQVTRGQLLTSDGGSSGLEIPAGTRISAYLSRHGLTFSASPHLTWRSAWAPDANIQRLTYDFSSARFTADASGFGPDFLYRNAVEENANSELTLRLPPAMRQPGYNPFADPELETNVQRMIDLLTSTSDPDTGAARERDFAQVSAPSVSFDFTLPEERRIQLPGAEQSAWIEAGTRIDISMSTNGPIDAPQLSSLRVSFSEPVIVGKGEEKPDGFGHMDLHAFNLAANGQITLEYELGPEQAIDGVRGLFLLLAIASDARVAAQANTGSFERTRMERLRGQIQEQIDSGIEPQFADLVRRNDDLLPGLSLREFFGIQ